MNAKSQVITSELSPNSHNSSDGISVYTHPFAVPHCADCTTHVSPCWIYHSSHHHLAYKSDGAVSHVSTREVNSGSLYHHSKFIFHLVGVQSFVISFPCTMINAHVHPSECTVKLEFGIFFKQRTDSPFEPISL